jgi:NTE family protein
MIPANIDMLLGDIPLFFSLSSRDRDLIKEKSEVFEYKKGDIIYRQNDPPGWFYCILQGRVLIYAQNEHGNKTILEYLHHGKYFGIISLLTYEPHSVSAEAMNDCLVLAVKKEDFELLLKSIPGLAIDLSRTLSRRLKRKDIHQKTIFESTVLSVFSSYSQAGKSVYALNLAISLQKETHKSVVILDVAPRDKVHSLPRRLKVSDHKVLDLSDNIADNAGVVRDFICRDRFGIDLICFSYEPQDDLCVKRMCAILSLLVNDYHYLILDLPSLLDRPVYSMLNQSDLIHTLTSPETVDLNRTHQLVERLKSEFGFHEDKIKIIINEYKFSKLSYEEQIQILDCQAFATLPKIDFEAPDILILDDPDSEYSRVIKRIARRIGDCLVGLVLGVGLGYGFCHIGVLKVIEEEKIPIDIIAGSSIGALIASLWVTGRSSDEILKITSEFSEPKHIWNLIDLTFPRLGFIEGNKLYKFLKKHLGNKTFHDIKLPLKIIASDVKRKEPRVLDKGLLVDAIMASCAMPGVFKPIRLKEEFLFDGGVINPLPTEPLFRMGVKKIIAVNVTPSREDIARQHEKIKQQMGVGESERPGIRQRIKNMFKHNILDIIFSSFEVLQSEVAEKESQLADVVLHPNTSGLYWLDLHKSAEFAKRGEEEARRYIDKIKQLVNE